LPPPSICSGKLGPTVFGGAGNLHWNHSAYGFRKAQALRLDFCDLRFSIVRNACRFVTAFDILPICNLRLEIAD
jgi:hypothetical protein